MSQSINKMVKKIKQMEKQNKSVHDIYDYFVYNERIQYNLKRFKYEI